MSAAWWGRESLNRTGPGPLDPPQLTPPGRAGVRAAVEARIAAFTPEWRRRTPGDAGDALLSLHGELAEPLLERLNRMPEKAFREYLRTAGISAVAARPARATLAFTVSDTAPSSALIPPGFQVAASAADGSGGRVIFETETALYAAPGKIASTFVQDGSRFFDIPLTGTDPAANNLVFGNVPRPGAALLIGLSGNVAPGPNITFMIHRTTRVGPPPAIAHGGIGTDAAVAHPSCAGASSTAVVSKSAEIIRDESRGLLQSGLVELRCPRSWRTGIPAGVTVPKPLRWLRLQLVAGAFASPPALAFIELNAVTALAARTLRGEVLDYVPDSDGRRMRVTQRPVLPGSLEAHRRRGRDRRGRRRRRPTLARNRGPRCLRSRRPRIRARRSHRRAAIRRRRTRHAAAARHPPRRRAALPGGHRRCRRGRRQRRSPASCRRFPS